MVALALLAEQRMMYRRRRLMGSETRRPSHPNEIPPGKKLNPAHLIHWARLTSTRIEKE
jgi:hypothetical protein